MTDREQFEAWASDNGAWPKAIERDGEGYKFMGTQQKWGAWKAARNIQEMQPQAEAVPWVNDDLDGMVEALWRVIDAHYNTKQPFHNPVYADARMAHRILVGYLPYMKNAAIAQQKAK